jgi:hypothetical protein
VAWGRTAMPGRNQFDDTGAAAFWRRPLTVVPIDAGSGPATRRRSMSPGASRCSPWAESAATTGAPTWTPDGTTWSRRQIPTRRGRGRAPRGHRRRVPRGRRRGGRLRSSLRMAWHRRRRPAAHARARWRQPHRRNPRRLPAVGWIDDGATYDGAAAVRRWPLVGEDRATPRRRPDTQLWRSVPSRAAAP